MLIGTGSYPAVISLCNDRSVNPTFILMFHKSCLPKIRKAIMDAHLTSSRADCPALPERQKKVNFIYVLVAVPMNFQQ
jgi:hypothetical protein